MKILITGVTGKLGSALKRLIPSVLSPCHNELDIASKYDVFGYIKNNLPDVIVHAAALTGVVTCDKNKINAWKTNVEGTENLVDACLKFKTNTRFIYVSTACVFDGNRGGYTEEDVPEPQNYYAMTKLVGEYVVKKLRNYVIVRTNFVAKEPWPYPKAFTDRFGTYLFATGVASGLKDLTESSITGIVHICGDKKMSMFDLAKITSPNVEPTLLKEYTGPHLTVDMSLDTKRWKKYSITD